MMYLILIESDPSSLPQDLSEKKKIMASNIENIKKDLDNGELKMVGISPGLGSGFFVSEQDPKVILGKRIMSTANVKKFKVKPMLSLEEVEAVIKEIKP